MIIQALCDYYQRKLTFEPGNLPPIGYESNAISFVVVIDNDGHYINLDDWRIGEGRKPHGTPEFVPQGKDRTGVKAWETAFLLWDHPRYVFGPAMPGNDPLASKRFDQFRKRISEVFPDPSRDVGVQAVTNFLENPPWEKIQQHPLWKEIEASTGNVSFKLASEKVLVCQSQTVQEVVACEFENDEGIGVGYCLISGELGAIERLHPATPVQGSQSTAKIHSFNLPAFISFGKEQGANAPVGKRAAFAYTTALNHLLSRESSQRIQVGDASTVFWSEKPSVLEDSFADIFDEPPKDDPAKQTRAIEALFKSPQAGALPDEGGDTRFYVLGLAPNAARISVRFWLVGTVAEMSERVRQHFGDLNIVHASYEKPHLSLFRLLVSTATQGKSENIPPNLSGDLMRAILEGLPYPQTLLAAAVRRIRAEREVTYPRAALIKACLNRQARYSVSSSERTRLETPSQEKEIAVSLDESNMNPGYRTGRLFAVLEKVQEETVNPSATIRDRFYGAASSTPVTVFANLMKLKNHHLAKLEEGRKRYFEKLIGEIMSGINDFPAHLSLADQGRFAIGYYHQRQAFFTKSSDSTNKGA